MSPYCARKTDQIGPSHPAPMTRPCHGNKMPNINYIMPTKRSSRSSVDFCLGIIGDPQYADVDNFEVQLMVYDLDPISGEKVLTFDQKRVRNYRNSLDVVKEASTTFKKTDGCVCTVVLGDIIDKAARLNDTYAQCRIRLLDTISAYDIDENDGKVKSGSKRKGTEAARRNEYLFCFGNNDADLTNEDKDYASRKEWIHSFIPKSLNPLTFTTDKIYYDYVPSPGYRIVVLDCYDVNFYCGGTTENKLLGLRLLNDNNPFWNDFSITYEAKYSNFPSEKVKYQKYNGGIGTEQMRWLENTLGNAASEIVICCGHLPLHPSSVSTIDGFLYNNTELMDLFNRHNCVKAYLSGHDHDGGYAKCPVSGIHYITPRAPIELCAGQTSYGYLKFFSHKKGMELVWFGETPYNKKIFPQWPQGYVEFR